MFDAEAQTLEFAWMRDLPKREKSKVAKAVDLVKEFTELQRQHGALVPASMVASVLNLSRERVRQFIDDGRLPAVNFRGSWYVGEDDLKEFAKQERKTGRPPKAPSFGECMAMAKDLVKAAHKK